METKFNSQICTTREQSERLIALGLKKETADMYYSYDIICAKPYFKVVEFMNGCVPEDIFPAWSMHRLIEMIPTHIYQGEHEFYRTIKPHSILYMPVDMESMWSIGRVVVNTNNYYDGIIEMYEWLIKEGYFNKEYLV